MRKKVLIVSILFLPFILFAIMASLLYVPQVQKWAVKKATEYATEQTGMAISIGYVRLCFPLNLELRDVWAADSLTLSAKADRLMVHIDASNILQSEIGVNEIRLDGADIAYLLPDSTTNDTTEKTPLQWTLSLKGISISDTRLRLTMQTDTSEILTHIHSLSLRDGCLDLGKEKYQASEIQASFDSIYYARNHKDTIAIRELLDVQLMQFCYDMPSEYIETNLMVHTPYSTLSGEAKTYLTAFSNEPTGVFSTTLSINLSMCDIRTYLKNYLPKNIEKSLPSKNICAQISLSGNMDELDVKDIRVDWSEIVTLEMEGKLTNLLSENEMGIETECNILTGKHTILNKIVNPNIFPITDLQLKTKAELKGQHYKVSAKLDEIKQHTGLSANVDMEGCGFDWQSPSTSFDGDLQIDRLKYDRWKFDNLDLEAHLHDQQGSMEMCCNDSLVRFSACASAELGKELKNAFLDLDVEEIDLHELGITKDTLDMSLSLHMDATSNWKDRHSIEASLKNIQLAVKDTLFHPLDLNIKSTLSPDTLFAWLNAGDLQLKMSAYENLDSLIDKSQIFIQSLEKQVKNYRIQQDSLTELLPNVNITLQSGSQNPINNVMRQFTGCCFDHLDLNMSISPYLGLYGSGYVNAFTIGSMTIDTLNLNLSQDSTGISLKSHIQNRVDNKSGAFNAWLKAGITSSGAMAHVIFEDKKGERGVDLGANVDYREDGIRIQFQPLQPVLAYRTFTVNEDNFIQLDKDGRLGANLDLLADDGTGLKLYSITNDSVKQDLTLSINHFNLGELARAVPLMPNIEGLLQGDTHLLQTYSDLSVSSDIEINKLSLDGVALGHVGMNLVYLPNSDGSHFMDGIVTQNDEEVLTLSGSYTPDEKEGTLNGTAQLTHLPMSLANGFFPDNVCRLEGFAWGEIDLSGTPNRPLLSGQFRTEGLKVHSDPYSIHLQMPDDTIMIENNQVHLTNIRAYAAGKNALTMDGTIDFRETDNIHMNIGVKANNYELINAPRKRESVAYGKVYVNVNSRIAGTLDNIHVRGRLDVLGKTNVTYILRESPITVEDRLSDLVTFEDFTDTLKVENEETIQPQHLDVQLLLSIEQSAQIHCLLSEDGNDYVKLEGGGDLTFTYDTDNNMRFFGRYTILSGQMKYTLMSVVCKNFNIQNGSYVEFQGDIMNPRLHIDATERVLASVSAEGGAPRSVTFDVGLSISQTLKNMGLEFTLQAPEDISIQNELAAMGSDERGRVAVTMLATGMYLTENNKSSGYSNTNALNNFLQSEINKIVGMAQNTIDVQFGMESNTNAAGSMQTDYSFSFAKRFWGNRISIVLGGKVSKGNDAVNTGQTIIDNVSIEYRLDQTGTRYVRLFYDKNYESLLEGKLTEMGAGILLRRKSDNLGDLFIFKRKKEEKEK